MLVAVNMTLRLIARYIAAVSYTHLDVYKRQFVDYFILYVNTLTYSSFSENNTVSYNSTFFNDASTTD